MMIPGFLCGEFFYQNVNSSVDGLLDKNDHWTNVVHILSLSRVLWENGMREKRILAHMLQAQLLLTEAAKRTLVK